MIDRCPTVPSTTRPASRAGVRLQALGSLAAATLAALLMAACGPGLGGTGTGAEVDAVAAYGAREVSVCQSEFADLVGCTPAGPAAAPLPAAGPRFFAEAEPASRVLLELDGQQAQLRLRCQGRVFVGTFAQVAGDTPRYYGTVVENGSLVRLAALDVRRAAGGLTVTLIEAPPQGAVFGPLTLAAVSGATAAACP